jgi:hypothetical protein
MHILWQLIRQMLSTHAALVRALGVDVEWSHEVLARLLYRVSIHSLVAVPASVDASPPGYPFHLGDLFDLLESPGEVRAVMVETLAAEPNLQRWVQNICGGGVAPASRSPAPENSSGAPDPAPVVAADIPSVGEDDEYEEDAVAPPCWFRVASGWSPAVLQDVPLVRHAGLRCELPYHRVLLCDLPHPRMGVVVEGAGRKRASSSSSLVTVHSCSSSSSFHAMPGPSAPPPSRRRMAVEIAPQTSGVVSGHSSHRTIRAVVLAAQQRYLEVIPRPRGISCATRIIPPPGDPPHPPGGTTFQRCELLRLGLSDYHSDIVMWRHLVWDATANFNHIRLRRERAERAAGGSHADISRPPHPPNPPSSSSGRNLQLTYRDIFR